MKKVTVVCTILNEQDIIVELLESLKAQTLRPAEIIIADGGSTDGSQTIIKQWNKKNPSINLQLINVKGNRSKGRNAAIKNATTTYIAITDAGCVPDNNWLEELVEAQQNSKAPVVAGYYRGLVKTNFEQAVVPYALVMPDQVDPAHFLPATRSMLIDKAIWRKLNGFDESLSDNEDYDFARRLADQKIPIAFAQRAVVGWEPRGNLKDFFVMIFRFSRGDAQAKLFRPKVLLVFIRYLVALGTIAALAIYSDWKNAFATILIFFTIYGLWSVHKNVRYVPRGWYWLPVLQYTADMAVMWGSMVGLTKSILN